MRAFHVSYRLSLATVLPMLVAVVGLGITLRSYESGRENVMVLAGSLFREVAASAAAQSQHHLTQAVPAIENLRLRGRTVMVFDEEEQVADELLLLLRANPGFSWVCFGRDDGTFIGAYRTSAGVTRINISHFAAGASPMQEWTIADDGTRTPYRHVENHGYDPRTRPFYERAIRAQGPVWLDPYVFFDEGIPGITLAAPAVDRHGAVRGVFTIDFGLSRLSEFVRAIEPSEHGLAFVFTDHGELVGHPRLDLVDQRGHQAEGRIVRLADVDDPGTRGFHRALGGTDSHLCPARARSRRFQYGAAGERYDAYVTCFPLSGGLRWGVAVVAPEDDFLGEVRRNNLIGFAISLLAVLAAVALSFVLAGRIARPLEEMAGEMEAVGKFDLLARDGRRTLFSEILAMQGALAGMKNGLRSFAAFVPTGVVRRIVETGRRAELGGSTVRITVTFSDLAGFTTMSETMSPDDLVKRLGGYLEEMTSIIEAHDGTVDKFIGDAVMSFWGAPDPVEEHEARACEAALRAAARLEQLAKEPGFEWVAATYTRFGLASGDALVGNIGTARRMNYTAMGDVVNLAARLESLNKQYGTRMMIAESTYLAARSRVVARAVDQVAVKGKAEAIRVYELLACRAEASEHDLWLEEASARALDDYVAGRFDLAAAAWGAISARDPNDPVAKAMATRAVDLHANPPPEPWTGVRVAGAK
jgi:adenylate cyclase